MITMHEPDNRIYPAYGDMVRQLFKLMPEHPRASLLHAVVGISGEAAEFANATSFKNILEEGGDMEFYVEAAKQHFTPDYSEVAFIVDLDPRARAIPIGNVFDNMVSLAGDILDLVKKTWVYNKDPADVAAKLTAFFVLLEMNLAALYEMFGLDKLVVQHANQVKLIGPGGRFESGFYSDAQANARADKAADKPAGSDRKFFGQQVPAPCDGKVQG